MQAVLERILGRPMMLPAGEGDAGGEGAAPAQTSDAPSQGNDDQARDDDAPSDYDNGEDPDAEQVEGEDEVDGPERKAAEQAAAAEAFDEIEIDGKKLKYSPELRDYLMRQADYQRNIQQVVEERKAFAAERERLFNVSQERVVKQGQLANADDMIARYQQIDWNTLRQENPDLAQARLIEWQQWKDARENLNREVWQIDAKVEEDRKNRELETSRETERRVQEAQAVLHRDIPNWRDVAPKVAEYAMREHGFTIQQLNAIDDPRFGKLMHQAWQGHELAQKQKTAAVARTQPKLVTEVAPLVTVGAKSGGATGRKSLADLAKADDMKAFVQTWEKTYPKKQGTGRR